MKIGIIVHSRTGNTHSVALKLKEKLLTLGHSVNIEKITPVDDKQMDVKKVRFGTLPEVDTYDALVFGAPVRAFSISPVLAAYLEQLSSLGNKKTVCFVTMFFPFSWLGGLKAIARMEKICESKGTKVSGTGIVSWSSKQREKMITDVVEKLSTLF